MKGKDPSGAVLSLGGKGEFDEKGVGVPYVVKDGALFHLWYEAVDAHSTYTIGHAVSADGITWTRQAPNTPALTGADDPGTYKEDSVWTASVLKTGDTYRMWYTVSDKPNSQRFGLAQMVPGSALGFARHDGRGLGDTKIAFTTTKPIPAGGSVLVTLPLERSGAGLAVAGERGLRGLDGRRRSHGRHRCQRPRCGPGRRGGAGHRRRRPRSEVHHPHGAERASRPGHRADVRPAGGAGTWNLDLALTGEPSGPAAPSACRCRGVRRRGRGRAGVGGRGAARSRRGRHLVALLRHGRRPHRPGHDQA